MSTLVQQNIGSFWNAVKLKSHVNRTRFHAGLKFQTGIASYVNVTWGQKRTIVDSVVIQEIKGQRKPIFSHILRSENERNWNAI